MGKFLEKRQDFDRQASDKDCDHGPSCPVFSLAGLVDQQNTYGIDQKFDDDKSLRRPNINVAEDSDVGLYGNYFSNQVKHLHRESHLGRSFKPFICCHLNLQALNKSCIQEAMA